MRMIHTLSDFPENETIVQWELIMTGHEMILNYRVKSDKNEWRPFLKLNNSGNISTWFSSFDMDTKAKISQQVKAIFDYV